MRDVVAKVLAEEWREFVRHIGEDADAIAVRAQGFHPFERTFIAIEPAGTVDFDDAMEVG